jgi:hypothetical protein
MKKKEMGVGEIVVRREGCKKKQTPHHWNSYSKSGLFILYLAFFSSGIVSEGSDLITETGEDCGLEIPMQLRFTTILTL